MMPNNLSLCVAEIGADIIHLLYLEFQNKKVLFRVERRGWERSEHPSRVTSILNGYVAWRLDINKILYILMSKKVPSGVNKPETSSQA